ncbi:class I SAM-dependent RNA methyltransferase, partial [Candidatus Uhrbacteria bacterium]|nr:class I SAM-dependent RNA methyltransferase [Candidatus Uhrbacteria bacterium]
MLDAIEITISTLDDKGRGNAETPRGPVAVPFSIPGDTVRVELRGKRKGVWRAHVLERMGVSTDRVAPRCPYVGTCGGCPWQMIDYPAQLRYKRTAVERALATTGSSDHAAASQFEPAYAIAIPAVEPSPDLFYYRNRMDYAIGARGEIGLKAADQWWNVLDLSTCFLLSPESVVIMERVRAWMREHQVQPWDNRTHRGFARYLVIREGKRTNERMVFLITSPGELPGREDFVARLQEHATSIIWGINPAITDISVARGLHVLHGNAELHEELRIVMPNDETRMTNQIRNPNDANVDHSSFDIRTSTFQFSIPPNAFFQTNTVMAERLVETVRELAGLSGTELVVDLYCGVGVFGIALARDAGRVIGVESEPSAIPVAQQNAIANGITNAQFVLATAESWSFPMDPIDVLIVDPPRSGLHPRVIQKVLALQPERIIYVSCNPVALARDLKLLTQKRGQTLSRKGSDPV